jgi:hypothetical protein
MNHIQCSQHSKLLQAGYLHCRFPYLYGRLSTLFNILKFTITPHASRTCRISLALSIGRIMPRQHPIFSLVLYLIFFFGAICLALVIQLTVACGRNTSWTHTPPYIYIPTRSTAIFILSGMWDHIIESCCLILA